MITWPCYLILLLYKFCRNCRNILALSSPNQLYLAMEKLTFTLPKIVPPQVPLAVQFDLLISQNPPCYALRFSSDIVLEGAWVSCTIPILFVSSNTPTYEMTRTDAEGEVRLGNKFSATLRLKPNCRSAEFYFRPVEGYSGTLEIFVSAVDSTGRLTQRESINLTPLSSYYRISDVDESRAYNTLQITGQFSFLKIQSWLQMIFQDVEGEDSEFRFDEHGGTFAFESMLLHCHLQCHVMEKEIIFRCENPSTIAILIQFITRQATSEKIKLDIRPKMVEETYSATLERLVRVITPIRSRNDLRNLTDALAEVTAAEGENAILHPDFRSENWKQMRNGDQPQKAEYKGNLDSANALIIDLMKDCAKLQGTSITSKLPHLVAILQTNHYTLKDLQNFVSAI